MADKGADVPTPGSDSYAVVEHDGWEVVSNTRTADEIRADIGADPEKDEASAAAAKLGKRGAAALKARKAEEDQGDEPGEAEAPEKPVAKAPEKAAKPKEDAEAQDDEPEPVKGDEGEKRSRARERVLEATRQTAQLKRDNTRLTEELTALRAKPAAVAPARAEAQDDDPEPQPQEGEEEVAFLERKARWWARQEFKTLNTKAQEHQRAESFQTYVRERSSAVEAAIEKEGGKEFLDGMSDDVLLLEPSFHVLARGDKPDALNALADEILRAGDNAPRLMRYLTERPEVIQRLSSPTLRPSEFSREMGRIEATLEAAIAGPSAVKRSSQAPRPARPVAGSPMLADAPPSDPDDYDGHVAYYNAKEGRGTRRQSA